MDNWRLILSEGLYTALRTLNVGFFILFAWGISYGIRKRSELLPASYTADGKTIVAYPDFAKRIYEWLFYLALLIPVGIFPVLWWDLFQPSPETWDLFGTWCLSWVFVAAHLYNQFHTAKYSDIIISDEGLEYPASWTTRSFARWEEIQQVLHRESSTLFLIKFASEKPLRIRWDYAGVRELAAILKEKLPPEKLSKARLGFSTLELRAKKVPPLPDRNTAVETELKNAPQEN